MIVQFMQPNTSGVQFVPYSFGPDGPPLSIPAACRVLGVEDVVFRIPQADGSTQVYVHPDDVAAIRQANSTETPA